MRLPLLLFMLAVVCHTTSATTPESIMQSGSYASPTSLSRHVAALPVYQEKLTPEMVLDLPDSVLLTAGQMPPVPATEAWIRYTIVNASDQGHSDLVSACEQPDSVEFFALRGGRIERIGMSGSRVEQRNVSDQRLRSLIDLRIPAHDSAIVLAHVWLPGPGAWEHVFHGSIRDIHQTFSRVREQFTLQAFYSGIMMVFMVISLLMLL